MCITEYTWNEHSIVNQLSFKLQKGYIVQHK